MEWVQNLPHVHVSWIIYGTIILDECWNKVLKWCISLVKKIRSGQFYKLTWLCRFMKGTSKCFELINTFKNYFSTKKKTNLQKFVGFLLKNNSVFMGYSRFCLSSNSYLQSYCSNDNREHSWHMDFILNKSISCVFCNLLGECNNKSS